MNNKKKKTMNEKEKTKTNMRKTKMRIMNMEKTEKNITMDDEMTTQATT